MYNAHCTWTPGTTAVAGQAYTWLVNGVPAASGALAAGANARDSAADEVTINHGDQVTCEVKSVNQWNSSEPLVVNGTAPTPTPEAPSGGAMSFSEVGGLP